MTKVYTLIEVQVALDSIGYKKVGIFLKRLTIDSGKKTDFTEQDIRQEAFSMLDRDMEEALFRAL